jgi:hypothetical protein
MRTGRPKAVLTVSSEERTHLVAITRSRCDNEQRSVLFRTFKRSSVCGSPRMALRSVKRVFNLPFTSRGAFSYGQSPWRSRCISCDLKLKSYTKWQPPSSYPKWK